MALFDDSGRYSYNGSISGYICDDYRSGADDGRFADVDVLNDGGSDAHKSRRLGNDMTGHPNAGTNMTGRTDMGFMIDDATGV